LSLFGGAGLAELSRATWLLPLLLVLLGLHLLFLLSHAGAKGYGPFLLSLAGAGVLVLDRLSHPLDRFILIAGLLGLLAGSLWNGFSADRFRKMSSPG
jgi:hypothetical protein